MVINSRFASDKVTHEPFIESDFVWFKVSLIPSEYVDAVVTGSPSVSTMVDLIRCGDDLTYKWASEPLDDIAKAKKIVYYPSAHEVVEDAFWLVDVLAEDSSVRRTLLLRTKGEVLDYVNNFNKIFGY